MKVVDGVKWLARKVIENCQDQGIHLSELECGFVIRAHVLSMGDEINLRNVQTLEEKELDELVIAVSDKMLSKNDPILETLKLQVGFEASYAAELLKLRRRKRKFEEKRSELIKRAVTTGSNLRSDPQDSGVPPDTINRKVERELASALESVFPQANLIAFNSLKHKQKLDNIDQLARVVNGIRLFNRQINKGGEGIADVPAMAMVEAKALQETLQKNLTLVEQKAKLYDEVLNFEYRNPGSIAGSVDRLMSELTQRRQLIMCYHQLLFETTSGLKSLRNMHQKLQLIMEELKSLVGGKTAIPKETVYPHFVSLSAVWASMEGEREMITMRQTVHGDIESYLTCFVPTLTSGDINLARDYNRLKESKVLEMKQAKDADMILLNRSVNTIGYAELKAMGEKGLNTPYRLIKKTTPEFGRLSLKYQGFCPYTIATLYGHLAEGNPDIGVIAYKGSFYTFQGMREMRQFSEEPDRILQGVREMVVESPHLAHLLDLQDELPNFAISVFLLAGDQRKSTSGATSHDVGTQTPTHFYPSVHIDTKYTWNEWDLRRRAIQMVNLTNKKTSGAQTVNSHFRRENASQYTLPRPYDDGSMPGKGTQTKTTQGTNVPRTLRYLGGLRGTVDTNFVEKRFIMDGNDVVKQT
ncbi:hypothetical protein AAMO2058_000923600 [Amorphochlora amoebiformis]